MQHYVKMLQHCVVIHCSPSLHGVTIRIKCSFFLIKEDFHIFVNSTLSFLFYFSNIYYFHVDRFKGTQFFFLSSLCFLSSSIICYLVYFSPSIIRLILSSTVPKYQFKDIKFFSTLTIIIFKALLAFKTATFQQHSHIS